MRITVREVSGALGKSRHWVYANCYALDVRPPDWLLDAGVLVRLVRRSFLSKSYELYPYEVLATKGWNLLEERSLREAWGKLVSSPESACEFMFMVMRLLPKTSMGNHVAYVHRVVGNDFGFRRILKGYAFAKLAGQFLNGQAMVGDLGLKADWADFNMQEFKDELRRFLLKNKTF